MGGALGNIFKYCKNYYISHALESLCIVGVNTFVLISGYFSTTTIKIKINKAISLYLLMVFYGVIGYAISIVARVNVFSIKECIYCIIPFFASRRWFVKTYILFLFLILFLN